MLAVASWTELATTDFAAPNRARAIAVLPLAAIEQHGPHLPLGVDAMIMDGLLARVAARLPENSPALFLPVQTIGASLEHSDFPGTLTLSHETMLRVVTEIGESVFRAGLRKLVLLNSHGGNSPILSQAALILRERCKALVVTCSWSRFGYPPDLFGAEEIAHGIHGGAVETSLMLAFRPELVDMDEAKNFAPKTLDFARDFKWLRADRPAGFGWMARDLSPDGAMGDASAASAENGAALADFWAGAFLELLRDVDAFELTTLSSSPAKGDATS